MVLLDLIAPFAVVLAILFWQLWLYRPWRKPPERPAVAPDPAPDADRSAGGA